MVFWQMLEHIFAGIGVFFSLLTLFFLGDYIGGKREKEKAKLVHPTIEDGIALGGFVTPEEETANENSD